MYEDYEDNNDDDKPDDTRNPKLIIQSYYETLRERMSEDGTLNVLQMNLLLAANRWLYQKNADMELSPGTVPDLLSDPTLDMLSHMFNAIGMPGVQLLEQDSGVGYHLGFKPDTDQEESDKAIREFCSYGFDLYFSGTRNAEFFEESTGKTIEPCDCAACHAVNSLGDLHPDMLPPCYDNYEAANLTQKVLDNLDALDMLDERTKGTKADVPAVRENAINPDDVEDLDDLMDQLFNPEED